MAYNTINGRSTRSYITKKDKIIPFHDDDDDDDDEANATPTPQDAQSEPKEEKYISSTQLVKISESTMMR